MLWCVHKLESVNTVCMLAVYIFMHMLCYCGWCCYNADLSDHIAAIL